MAASRRFARKLPSIISKHQRLISPEIETAETLQDSTSPASIPLDPSLPLLPLAVSHLSPPSPLPALPSSHASSPASLLRLLRRARHHPRLAPLDLHLLLAAASASSAFRPDHALTSLLAARLAASRRLPSLRRLLELVLSRPCPCTDDSIFACPELLPTFRKAILAFATSGDIPSASDALASLRRAADSPLPAEFYNIVLHALARLRRHDDAIRFYGEMTSVHRVAPDAVIPRVMPVLSPWDTKLSLPNHRDVTNNQISTNIRIQVKDTTEFGVRNQQKQGDGKLEQEVRNWRRGREAGTRFQLFDPSLCGDLLAYKASVHSPV